MMKVQVMIQGNAQAVLNRQMIRLSKKTENGLIAASEVLLEEANKLCPRDIEALVDSGRASKVGSGFDTLAVVGYGGIDFPSRTEISNKTGKMVTREPYKYAVYAHEVPPVHEVDHTNFLGEPCKTKTAEMITALNAAL